MVLLESIAWHEDCNKNAMSHYEASLDHLAREQYRTQVKYVETLFHKHQITCAIKEKKMKFSRERYKMKNREDFIRDKMLELFKVEYCA